MFVFWVSLIHRKRHWLSILLCIVWDLKIDTLSQGVFINDVMQVREEFNNLIFTFVCGIINWQLLSTGWKSIPNTWMHMCTLMHVHTGMYTPMHKCDCNYLILFHWLLFLGSWESLKTHWFSNGTHYDFVFRIMSKDAINI